MSLKFIEVMNVRIPAGSRTLYLDLGQNEDGTRFLSISEVRGSGPAERSRILVDERYVADLHRAVSAVLELMGGKPSPKAYSVEEKRRNHGRAYKLWTAEEENELKQGYSQGRGVKDLAEQHGRAPTAIISRLYQLGVVKAREKPRWE